MGLGTAVRHLAVSTLILLPLPAAALTAGGSGDGDSAETAIEQALARAEEEAARSGDVRVAPPSSRGTGGGGPLFIGVDDITISTYRVDVTNGTATPQFTGFQIWGAAYDPDNDRVLFNNGSTLYEWPVGGAVNPLGTMTVPGGATINFVGLAFHDGSLYGVRNIANEAVYTIDTTTLVATVLIDYVDGDFDLGGFAVDPVTGDFYATNDDTTPNGSGLFRINNDGTGTLITPYPGGETDIDGLAIGGGFAYLVTDQPGSIYVWDLAGGVFAPPLPNPWTTSEVFSGGAWIETVSAAQVSLVKTVGTVPAVCAATDSITVSTGTAVYYCYEVENTGSVTLNFHDLDDDHLGQLLANEPITLDPGGTYQHIEPDVATATVTNTGTWTAKDAVPGYQFDATVANGFVDISATGAALNLTDDSEANITLAFPFELYGVASTDIRVSNNGVLLHGVTSGDVPFTNVALPTANLPAAAICTYWDDLDDESGNVYHQGFGAAPNRTHIIQWHQRPHFPGPNANTVTFQVVLHETSNEIDFFYQDTTFGDPATDNGASATVGVQQSSSFANQYSFDTPASIPDTEAILVALGTVVEASASDTATVTIADPDISVDPTSLSSLQLPDTQVVLPLDIMNTGQADLDWDITESAGLRGGDAQVRAPGRQEPIRTHRQSVKPATARTSAGDHLFSRAAGDPALAKAATPVRPEVPDGTVTITHSASQSIISLNSVSCNAGGLHTNNSYIRKFDLGAFGITTDFDITQVEVGVEQAVGNGGTQPVTMNLYTWNPADPFTFANFNPIGTAPAMVPDQSLTILTVPVTGTAPAGSTLVVELFTPNGQATGNSFFVGSNNLGQTDASYIAAADCGAAEPTDLAVLGFPGMHIVMNVTGTAGCSDDLTWVSANPTAGTTLPAATDTVDVTFDSTGLVGGNLLTGSLCINSNDPDTPTLLVPLTLEVDTMPFLDGFETGDTSRWTVTVP